MSASCRQEENIKKLEIAVAKNNIRKAEKELLDIQHISDAEYTRLCQLSVENKNLAVPLMLIEKGMSPDIYVSDLPLSFYFVDFATNSEFSELLKANVNLQLTDNKEFRNILEYSVCLDKKDFFTALEKKMAEYSSEASFINQMFRILKYAIRTKKINYAHAIIEDVTFSDREKYDCLKYFEELILKQVPEDLVASFLKKNKDILLKTEMFSYHVVTHYSYLKACGMDISDAKLIIPDEAVADILLDGDPKGIKWFLNKIDCKKKYPMNGELREIKDILNYRIRIKSGAIDGSYEEMKEKNKNEIQLLKQVKQSL